MSDISPEKNQQLNVNVAIALVLMVAMIAMSYEYWFIVYAFLWRILKIAQMFTFSLIEQCIVFIGQFFGFSGWGFSDALDEVLNVHYSQITPKYIDLYDGYFGSRLKYPFAIVLLWVAYKENSRRSITRKEYTVETIIRSAAKVHPHLRPYVPPTRFDKLLAYTLGWAFSSLKERLKGENPCDFHHDFDFNDRSSFNNRYAMGVSHYEMLTANPPLGVTKEEIERDKQMQKETGFVSNFRPITYFFYDENPEDSSFDFCSRTATICLERLLLQPLSQEISDESLVGRLFDDNGKLVELTYIDAKGESCNKLKKGGRIVNGFRPTNLLNDGNEYKGKPEDTILLFNEVERRILMQLKSKMPKELPRSFEDILYALVLKKHAFSSTVIWGMMDLFKNASRVAGTEFSWVTRLNRGLGMVMQSIGRETPFIEAASVRSHYLMECKLGFRLTVPTVLTAVQDLHENSQRILNAGVKKENLLGMDEDEYNEKFSLSKLSGDQNRKEKEAVKILKGLGIDVEREEPIFDDPFADIPELMKKFKETE